MIFQSIDYLVFFVAVFAIYWRLPHKGQHALLLIAGYIFYGYVHPWYCILLGATTLVDFTFTRLMEDRPARKRLWLICILVSNFSILAAFKYFDFFTDNVLAVLHLIGWDAPRPVFEMLLPAGVSFYTFQSCAYALDVYRGQTWARRSLLDYAVYVSFFPQLVAGPIERAGHLLSQFEKPRRFDWSVARDALFLILWGLVKKRVIADTAAVFCNKAFSLSDSTFPIVWAGVLCFCVQIYADFSAYTDIARGSARLLGLISARISITPGSRNRPPTSGGAGTCPSHRGFATTFSFPSEDRAAPSCAWHGISCSPFSSPASGMARAGTSSSGAAGGARCSCSGAGWINGCLASLKARARVVPSCVGV